MHNNAAIVGDFQDLEKAVAALAPPGEMFTPDQMSAYLDAARTAVEAYVYGYPLLLMEATLTQFMVGTKVGVNAFYNVQELATPSETQVVRPNVDTLYSVAYLNLSHGPIVLTIPPTNGTYVLMQIMDAWSNVIGDPGSAHGAGAAEQRVAIVGPDRQGNLPDGLKSIQSTTNLVWIVGRTAVGPDDLDKVHALQKQYTLTQLQPGLPAVAWESVFSPAILLTDETPSLIIEALPATVFFDHLARAMIKNPAYDYDAPALQHFATIGFVPGEKFTPTPAASVVLPIVPTLAHHLMLQKATTIGTKENNWNVTLSGIGDYGVHYLVRGAIALTGFGANRPETAVYPFTSMDRNNNALNGNNTYQIHFPAGQIPPASAFWSLTLYNSKGYLQANAENKYDINSYSAVPNQDGSLDLFISPVQPAQAKPANWLPSNNSANRTNGDTIFSLMLRLYEPAASVFTGAWKPPYVDLIEDGTNS